MKKIEDPVQSTKSRYSIGVATHGYFECRNRDFPNLGSLIENTPRLFQGIILLIFFHFLAIKGVGQSKEFVIPPSLSDSDKIEFFLERMTIEEKIGQMTQLDITMINTTGRQQDVHIDEDKLRTLLREYHIGSFLNGEAVSGEVWFNYMDTLTRIAMEESRLGIPIVYGIDHMHGASYVQNATIFPHNINIGATFDTTHARNMGQITVYESADLGHHWVFSPVLDLARTPLWARHYETYGEDPVLVASMGAAFVRGVQGRSDSSMPKVFATGKHFIGYSDPRSGWDRTPAVISDQQLQELHRPGFQAAIDAGLKTIMVNSGEVNGVPVHASRKLLTELLRNQMGFEGVIITDWGDIEKLVNYHKVAENIKEATYMAIQAGIDISMTPKDVSFNHALSDLVEEGRISEERINASVRRILKLKFDLGLFQNPYPRGDRFHKRIGADLHRKKALEAARESIVLLKNNGNILPLNEPKHIVVAGLSANSKRNLSGGWTYKWQGGKEESYPKSMATVFSAFQEAYPKAKVRWIPFGDFHTDTTWREAEVVIYVAGEEPYTEFVGNSDDLTLSEEQRNEIELLRSYKGKRILVLVEGRPRIITSIVDAVDAILWAGLPGFEGAEAIVDTISGAENPSGKLSFSYPKSTGHFIPYNHKAGDVYFFNSEIENNIVGSTKETNLYPFGHGLSYSSFEYSPISLTRYKLSTEETITASIVVRNKSAFDGKEAVLWFLSDRVGTITRPVKALKYFEKRLIRSGEEEEFRFTINKKHLSYPSAEGVPMLKKGTFTLRAGNQTINFTLE